MLPILEALSVNLRGSGIDNTKFSEAFSTITSRSSSTFHYLTKELNLPSNKQDALMYKLMSTYANVLANEIILYGNDNLNAFDEVFKSFVIKNTDWFFADKLQNDNEGMIVPEYDLHIAKVEAAMVMLNSVWVFHNNLYVGGFIKVSQLQIMNEVGTDYLFKLLDAHIHATFDGSDKEESLKPMFWMFCSQLLGKAMVTFENRLVKSADDVQKYVNDPAPFFERLTPMLSANMVAVNGVIAKVVTNVGGVK